MIVPQNRLLFWFAVIVLPFSVLGTVEASAAVVAGIAIGGFILFALADALGARSSLSGVSLQSPAVTRMSKDRATKLEVRIRNPRQRSKLLRLALALPSEIASPQEESWVALPGGSEWSRVSWACTPQRRGRYRLDSARVETASRFGFWAARRTLPLDSELRVYPNLGTERRDLAGLFLHRGALGLHTQRQLGKGREFEKLREYIPGDSYDEIHWKATARRGRPITKTYQIERTQEIYVIIDASRLSARLVPKAQSATAATKVPASAPQTGVPFGGDMAAPPAPETTLERFITAALVLGLAAEEQGDLFGLMTFTDSVGTFIRARNGKAHHTACRDALYRLEPKIVSPDYEEASTFIRLRLRRRALLVFLTALDDPVLAESFVRNLDLLCRHHVVLVNMLQPPGIAPLFSETPVAAVDDLYERLGGHLLWESLRELDKVLQRRGVRFSLLKNERLSSQLVALYLNVKRRQML